MKPKFDTIPPDTVEKVDKLLNDAFDSLNTAAANPGAYPSPIDEAVRIIQEARKILESSATPAPLVLERNPSLLESVPERGSRPILTESIGAIVYDSINDKKVWMQALSEGSEDLLSDQLTFTTSNDSQTELRVDIYSKSSKNKNTNRFLGRIQISELPSAPKGATDVNIILEATLNGELVVSAQDPYSKRHYSCQIKF